MRKVILILAVLAILGSTIAKQEEKTPLAAHNGFFDFIKNLFGGKSDSAPAVNVPTAEDIAKLKAQAEACKGINKGIEEIDKKLPDLQKAADQAADVAKKTPDLIQSIYDAAQSAAKLAQDAVDKVKAAKDELKKKWDDTKCTQALLLMP